MNQQNTTNPSGSDQQMNTASSTSSTDMGASATGAAGTSQSQGQLDAEAQAVLNPNPGNLSSNAPDLARCPVCGNTVEKASAAETLPASVNMPGERTLYFDTPECKAIFEQNPARFGSQR